MLQNLLSEGISIRDLVTIFETLADHAAVTRDTDILTEYVRQSLKPVSYTHLDVYKRQDSNPINTAKFPDNMMLSVHRAHSVYNYLVNNKGFDAKTMTSSGRGENVPIADNTTAEGRAQNRRVEIKIYNNLNSDIQ